jgi:hypothetical protein
MECINIFFFIYLFFLSFSRNATKHFERWPWTSSPPAVHTCFVSQPESSRALLLLAPDDFHSSFFFIFSVPSGGYNLKTLKSRDPFFFYIYVQTHTHTHTQMVGCVVNADYIFILKIKSIDVSVKLFEVFWPVNIYFHPPPQKFA